MTGTVSVHKRSLMCPCRWGSWLVTPTSGSTPLSVPGSNAGFSLPNADSLLGNRSVDCLDTQTTGVGYNLFAYTGNSSAEYVSACLWVKVGGSRVGVCACVLSTCFAGAADARPVMMRLRGGAGRGGAGRIPQHSIGIGESVVAKRHARAGDCQRHPGHQHHHPPYQSRGTQGALDCTGPERLDDRLYVARVLRARLEGANGLRTA